MLYTFATHSGVRISAWDFRQHRAIHARPTTHTHRWSGWISRGLICKISSPQVMRDNFFSFRYWLSLSKRKILKWKQYKIRHISQRSSCALWDALSILKNCSYPITVQSGCGSQSAFLKYRKEQVYRKKTTRRYQKKHSVELPLKALLGKIMPWDCLLEIQPF